MQSKKPIQAADQTAPRPYVQGRSLVSRRKVLDATVKLLNEKGYSGTRLSDIIALSGVSSGSVYHQFGSKEGVVDQLLDDFLAQMRTAFDDLDVTGLPLETKLRKLIRLALAGFRGNPGLYRAVQELSTTDPEYWQRLRSLSRYAESRFIEILRPDFDAFGRTDPEDAVCEYLQYLVSIGLNMIFTDPGPIRLNQTGVSDHLIRIARGVFELTPAHPQSDT